MIKYCIVCKIKLYIYICINVHDIARQWKHYMFLLI